MAGFGSAPSLIIAAGVGAAAAAALDPAFEVPTQEAWKRNPRKLLDTATIARLVAQGGVPIGYAYEDGQRHGYSQDKVDQLVWLNQTVPGVAELLFLWRLGVISRTEWEQGMTKLQMHPVWMRRVAETFTVPLTAEQVAVMVQRSVIPNQGQLPGVAKAARGKVPVFPEVAIDGYHSAQAYGVSKDQLDALTRIQGLPPGMDLVARMVFRGILDRGDFNLAAEQANRRVEWADYEFEGYRQILTANQYAELELRGFLTREQRLALTAQTGMSEVDSDRLYDVLGRSIPVHQIETGLRRGGVFDGPTDHIPEAFLQSLQRGNLRPEYFNMAYANRESYPSYFVIRPLVQSGAITEERATELFLGMGWPEDIARNAPAAFKGTAAGASDPHVAKAQTQLWSATHRSYIAEEAGDADARERFTLLGIPDAAQTTILALWQSERDLIRRQLTPKQIKDAWQGNIVNPATGAPWTQADALQALLDRGYSENDARTLLNE